jgi:glutamate 5-kinase
MSPIKTDIMEPLQFRKEIRRISTIVVKVGSRIITADNKFPDAQRMRGLVDSIVMLQQSGIRTVLVSSGAIAQGMAALGLPRRPKSIPQKQACASIGQIRLMSQYESHFSRHKVPIGQVLITWDDLRNKKRYLNLRNTLFHLFRCGAVPIINENDSVGIEEIRFGENDTLGAQIAMLIQADVFVNLSDISGLFDKNPKLHADAKHIPIVGHISASILKCASESTTEISVGGMITKLKAADIVTKAGICAIIGDGYAMGLLDVLKDPRAGTVFLPSPKIMPSKSRWIAFTGQSAGAVIVDEGARVAIVEQGKSLLPAGIRKVAGHFQPGDMIDMKSESNKTFARGLCNYSSDEVDKIIGCKTAEIAGRLGAKEFDEVIHRDNMVVIE